MSDYWVECIGIAFDECGIIATKEQIENVAGAVESAHENHGMAMGYDCIPNPVESERDALEKELEIERSKVTCKTCGGKGFLVTYGGTFCSESRCWKCQGEGRVRG